MAIYFTLVKFGLRFPSLKLFVMLCALIAVVWQFRKHDFKNATVMCGFYAQKAGMIVLTRMPTNPLYFTS